VPALCVPPQAIALVVLSPLLYTAAEELPPRDLRVVWRPVTILAFGLVFASAACPGHQAGDCHHTAGSLRSVDPVSGRTAWRVDEIFTAGLAFSTSS
jgi:hypothetical protein